MPGVLLDTNVLVDYLRDIPRAVKYLENMTGDMNISSMTVAELYAGIRSQQERELLREFISSFVIVAADGPICEMGGEFRAQYGPSHGIDLIDAIIAATSKLKQLPLVSLNKKHFPMLHNVIVPYRQRKS